MPDEYVSIMNRLNNINDKAALSRRWKGQTAEVEAQLRGSTPDMPISQEVNKPSIVKKTVFWAAVVTIGGLIAGFAKRDWNRR